MCKESFYLPKREQVDLPANFIPYNGLVYVILRIPQYVIDTRWHNCFKDKCTEVILDFINNTEHIITENTFFNREPYAKKKKWSSLLRSAETISKIKKEKVSIPI